MNYKQNSRENIIDSLFQHSAHGSQADKLTKHGQDERDHKQWVHSCTWVKTYFWNKMQ